MFVGCDVGEMEGNIDGAVLGLAAGSVVGESDGLFEGEREGVNVVIAFEQRFLMISIECFSKQTMTMKKYGQQR